MEETRVRPSLREPHRRDLATDRTPVLLAIALLLLPLSFALPQSLPAQTQIGPAEITIGGAVATPLTISAAELKKMPRQTLKVVNPHDKKTEVYEGVPLAELLKRAGVPQGEAVRGRCWRATFSSRLRTATAWCFLSPNSMLASWIRTSSWQTRWMARRSRQVRVRSSSWRRTKSAPHAGCVW